MYVQIDRNFKCKTFSKFHLHLKQTQPSPLPARLILNVVTTEAWRHRPTSRPKPPISLRPTPPSASDQLFFLSLSLSLSLSVFSSDRVPHYLTHLKSEHSISLWAHHHYLWSLIDDRRRSRQSVPNWIEYQAWVLVWLCWFFWVFVLFFFTSLAVLIFLGFCFVLLHWFWWAQWGCGCAVIFMDLMVVVVVCW